jgi:hypothetical protein
MPTGRTCVRILLVVCVTLLARGIAPAAEPPWVEIHSTHFIVITDAGEKKGREVALRFEQMRAVFAGLLSKDHLSQPVPLTILAFKNDKSYYQLAPLRQGQPIGVPGFFLAGEDQDFIVLNLSEEESWRAVAHDFGHMLLNYNYPSAQGWFDEGLVEYFSSVRVDDKQAEIGGDPELGPSAGADLPGNQHDPHPPKSLTELLEAQAWISIPDLFTMKHDASQFNSQANPGANEGAHNTMYYAESWMVMHYLIHEKKLPDTGTYFDLVLNQHAPVEEAIQKAYGMSSAQLEDAVKTYFHSQKQLDAALDAARQSAGAGTSKITPAQPYQFPAPVAPDDAMMPFKAFPEADAQALYAAVQIRIPERRNSGLQELKKLATTPTAADVKAEARAEAKAESKKEPQKDEDENPTLLPTDAIGNELAHRFLAWDHIEHGEFDDAVAELGDAAAINQRDMWVRYYLSVLKYRMAQAKHGDIQSLANMMLDLKAVLEWYPELANAYDLLALGRNEGGSSVAAMQAERAAIQLCPRNQHYAYHLAEIYIAARRWEAAQAQLERLKDSSDPEIAKLARDRLEQAASERRYGMAGAATVQPKLSPQKSPFDVLEEDAAKRTAEEKTQANNTTADTRPTKSFKGRLISVDCSHPPAAVLTLVTEGIALKLRAADYKSLLLIGADDFSCSWRDRQVTVNYKPGGASDGDLISLEIR